MIVSRFLQFANAYCQILEILLHSDRLIFLIDEPVNALSLISESDAGSVTSKMFALFANAKLPTYLRLEKPPRSSAAYCEFSNAYGAIETMVVLGVIVPPSLLAEYKTLPMTTSPLSLLKKSVSWNAFSSISTTFWKIPTDVILVL